MDYRTLVNVQSQTGKAHMFASTRGIFLAPNRLYIQTWDTQKHQKTASMEFSHECLGPANFFEAKKKTLLPLYTWAHFWCQTSNWATFQILHRQEISLFKNPPHRLSTSICYTRWGFLIGPQPNKPNMEAVSHLLVTWSVSCSSLYYFCPTMEISQRCLIKGFIFIFMVGISLIHYFYSIHIVFAFKLSRRDQLVHNQYPVVQAKDLAFYWVILLSKSSI